MTVVDLLEHKCKGKHFRHLRDEAHALDDYFRNRGTPPEEVYDILDAFRYIGLCHITYKDMSNEEAEKTRMVIADIIDDFRHQQGLPKWEELVEKFCSNLLMQLTAQGSWPFEFRDLAEQGMWGNSTLFGVFESVR